ncbi:ATP-binding protein [Kitasatospora sp. NPDC057904]|uniref:ATP-binding protein n=1 Tax=unclassified Kitasatospora TaxID=2633591 RepID=UPI0036DE906C
MHRVLHFTTPLQAACVAHARNRLLCHVSTLAHVGLDEGRRYALRLCSSEAIDNGIKHGGGQGDCRASELLIEVGIDSARQRLRITVTDGGLAVPLMEGRVGDLEATGGRGLAVICGYADDAGWGQRTNDLGEVVGWSVWFELDVTIPSATGQATAQAEVQPDPSRCQAVPAARAEATAARPQAPGRADAAWPTKHSAA